MVSKIAVKHLGVDNFLGVGYMYTYPHSIRGLEGGLNCCEKRKTPTHIEKNHRQTCSPRNPHHSGWESSETEMGSTAIATSKHRQQDAV